MGVHLRVMRVRETVLGCRWNGGRLAAIVVFPNTTPKSRLTWTSASDATTPFPSFPLPNSAATAAATVVLSGFTLAYRGKAGGGEALLLLAGPSTPSAALRSAGSFVSSRRFTCPPPWIPVP